MLPYNTFGMDVKAARFIEFDNEDELGELIREGIMAPVLVIGGGSNLLFVNDYEGTILHSRIFGMEVIDENDDYVSLRVGSGVNWDALVAYTVATGWQGLENLTAIPGEVGASAVQNVGAYGAEAGDFIESVEAVSLADASKRIFKYDDCEFAYRSSIFKKAEKGKYVITFVTFRLRKKPEYCVSYGNLSRMVEELGGLSVENIRRAVGEIRAAKLPDPAVLGSAGSFFVNPVVACNVAERLKLLYPEMPQYATPDGRVKLSAGWLIEQCGWKKAARGSVGVYEKQALVIVNYGGASGRDILAFANEVSASVKDKFGVELSMEVNIIE